MSDLLQQLDTVAALAAQATEGPWHIGRWRQGNEPWAPMISVEIGAPVCRMDRPGAPEKDAADAAFIAAARNLDWPALATALRATQAPAVAAGTGWVSVEERLPYYGEVALVAAAHPLGGFSVLQRTFRYMGEEGWQRHDTKGGKSDKAITHWMPLPAEPVTVEGSAGHA